MVKKFTAAVSAILLSAALTACNVMYDESSDDGSTVENVSESIPVSMGSSAGSGAESVP